MADLPEMDPLKIAERERRERIAKYNEIIFDGANFVDNWNKLAFEDPPEGIFERIWWSVSVLGQLILSGMTFPAALGAFLIEEAVQTYGMGAFMLHSAKDYETLDGYIDNWKKFIQHVGPASRNLAFMSPITGGAVLIYLEAAEVSANAFEAANDHNLLKQAETDEAARKKLLDRAKYASLRIQSSPNNAEIWMNGEDTNLLTPETFKQLDAGPYAFLLKKYSTVRDVMETFEFSIVLEAGYKKEIFVRIPKIIDGVPGTVEDPTETEEPQLPTFIDAAVVGDHAIDGDTFVTDKGERIRILAIDAPEIGRPWGEDSREAMGLLIEDKKISLRIQSHKPLDEYGRTLAIASSWKGDVAVFQLSSGLARVNIFDDDIYDPSKYVAAEQIARDRKIGIWS